MVVTNVAKDFITLRLGSSLPDLFIGHVGIGTGSGVSAPTNTTLFNEVDRQSITGSPDYSETRKVTFQTDFNSVQMSGINLTEFGLFNVASGTGFTGSTWQREAFEELVFDGSNELQIRATIQVI